MATQHQLSVLIQSSVKTPINPDNGLPNTFHERINTYGAFQHEANLEELSEDERDKPRQIDHEDVVKPDHVRHTYTLSPRDLNIEKLAEDLDTLSDEQFFNRLQDLKSEHQKTLKMCEKAYKNKISEMTGTASKLPSKTVLQPAVYSNDEDSYVDSDGDEEAKTKSLGHLSQSMDRIKEMWRDFNIEQYAPARSSLQERPASASGSFAYNKENLDIPSEPGDTWSPVITIPKPFKMTLREANKQKKKTKAQEELEQKRLEERKNEEAELSKKFKANPAPAHIYLPLYDEIAEQQETKRRLNHNYREELLRSIEKPFRFYVREEAKKRQKLQQAVYDVVKKEKQTEFKAKSVPKFINEDVTEKMAEEEEYRRIRVKMRAEELLKESRLPPSMDAREKSKELSRIKRLAQELRGLGLSTEPSFRPKISQHVPDFEEAHRKLYKKLARKKAEKEATVVQPFNLRTSRILSNKDKIIDDIINDEHERPETRWPYKTSRTKPSNIGKLSHAVTSEDRVPSMTTQSTELRKSHTKKRLTEETQREILKLEAQRKKRQKEKKLKSQVAEKAAANDITYNLVDQSADKLRRYREEERARAEEYRRNIREMQDRVKERPLLFETVAQRNAKQSAERRYNATLHKAGVSANRIRSADRVRPQQAEHLSSDNSDDAGSYRAPNRRSSRDRLTETADLRDDSVDYDDNRDYSYSNTFTKEDTGLSDKDFSDVESIPDETLEMA